MLATHKTAHRAAGLQPTIKQQLEPVALWNSFLSPASVKRTYSKHAVIVGPRKNSEIMFQIQSGSVKVVMDNPKGNTLVTRYFNAGDFFNYEPLFLEETSNYNLTAIAREDTTFYEIHHRKAKEYLYSYTAFSNQLAGQIITEKIALSDRLFQMAYEDTYHRTLKFLRTYASGPQAITHPNGMQFQITRTEIAQYIGASREMVGRIVEQLEAEGLIKAFGKTFVLHHYV